MATVDDLQVQINEKDVIIRSLTQNIKQLELENEILKERLRTIRQNVLESLAEDKE